MPNEVKEILFLNSGYITYVKGEDRTMIKADHISSIKYFADTGRAHIINVNNETTMFDCSKENFEKLMVGAYGLNNEYKFFPKRIDGILTSIVKSFTPITIELN